MVGHVYMSEPSGVAQLTERSKPDGERHPSVTGNEHQAMVLQSMEEAGNAEQQAKPKKVKRRREAESPADPEEALRLKAEAARIAAEVFAGAELADDDGAPEQEPTKVSAPS